MQTAIARPALKMVSVDHEDIQARLRTAKDALRHILRSGDAVAIKRTADYVRDIARLAAEAEIGAICAEPVEPLTVALQAAGVAPHLILKDVTIAVDDEDAQASLSTDGSVAAVNVTAPDMWKRKCDQIRATGCCPRCASNAINLSTARAGSVGSVQIYECFECGFEVPYAA